MILMSESNVPSRSERTSSGENPVWIVIEIHGDQPLLFLSDSREEFEAEAAACEEDRCRHLAVEVPARVDGVVGHGPVLDELIRLAVRTCRGVDDGSLCEALGRLDVRQVREALAKQQG